MKKICLIYIFISLSINLLTQELPSIVSPTAYTFSRLGSFPTSLNTGSIDISIPIYTLKSKGIELPIVLSYDASGVRVNGYPSDAGQNWTLLAGGVITRMTQNAEDDYIPRSGVYYGNYFKSGSSNFKRAKDVAANPTNVIAIAKRDDPWGNSTSVDMEPDIFIFNFMGISGQFHLGNDGQWKVSSSENIEIIFDYESSLNYDIPFMKYTPNGKTQLKSMKGFVLKDKHGTTYTFGYDTSAIEYSIPYVLNLNEATWYPDAWYLTKVTDPNGNLIYQLDYVRRSINANIAPYYNADFYSENEKGGAFNPTASSKYSTASNTDYNGKLIAPIYLSKITDIFNNITISFAQCAPYRKMYKYKNNDNYLTIKDTNTKYNGTGGEPFYNMSYFSGYLNSVNMANTAVLADLNFRNEIQKCIYNRSSSPNTMLPAEVLKYMTYSYIRGISISQKNKKIQYWDFYYNDNNIIDPNWSKRPFLSKIKLTGENSEGAYYNFSYYGDVNSFPEVFSTQTDYWGYYNGTMVGIGQFLGKYQFSKKDCDLLSIKAPNPQLMVMGSLKTITYPTGGISEFVYEPHSYTSVIGDNNTVLNEKGIAGGNRIKSIINYDKSSGVQKEIDRVNYYYSSSKNGVSSGVLAKKPKYYWETTYNVKEPNGKVTNAKITKKVFSLNSLVSLKNNFEPHVMYSSVIEEHPNNGYTLYQYTNMDTEKNENSYYSYNPEGSEIEDIMSDVSFKRGLLKKKQIFSKDNALLSTEDYSYKMTDPNDYTWACNFKMRYGNSSASYAHYTGGLYKVYYARMNLVQKKITEGYGQNVLTRDFKYSYEKKEISRGGKKIGLNYLKYEQEDDIYKTVYYYPFNFLEEQTNPSIYDTPYLLNQLRLDVPLKITRYKNNKIIKYSESKYALYDKKPYLSAYFEGNSLETASMQMFIDAYDTYGNIIKAHTPNSKMYYLYFGNKNESLIGVATYQNEANINLLLKYMSEVDNIYQLVKDYSSASNERIIKRFNDIRLLFADIALKTYTYYAPNRIYSSTDPRGVTTYYDYDAFGRLKRTYIKEGNTEKTLEEYDYNYSNK